MAEDQFRRERVPRGKGEVEAVTHRDRVRWQLAKYLILLLAGTVFLTFALLATSKWTGVQSNEIRGVFDLMFTALVALVGSAVGFYFGAEHARTHEGSGGGGRT